MTDDPADCDNAAFCMSQRAEIRALKAAVDDLMDAVADCVSQGCTMEDGTLDSLAISSYRDAILLLAQHGRVVIDHQYGRRVLAHWRVLDSP